jgi:hypothetical protein
VKSAFNFLSLLCLCVAFLAHPAYANYGSANFGELKVSGNKIVTVANNCPVFLKGVDIPSMEWQNTGEGPTGTTNGVLSTAQNAVNNWGVNFVRVPLNQDRWLGSSGCSGLNQAAYQKLVDDIVSWCAANNTTVLLDLHWSDEGSTGGCANAQHSMPDNGAVTFWTSVASHYAASTNVWFDLFNEPEGFTSWTLWKNGGTTPEGYNTPGMQTLVHTIRDTGAKNIITAGGLNWAFDLSQIPTYALTDANTAGTTSGNGIVYVTHIYPWKSNNPSCNSATCYSAAVPSAVTGTYAVMVTEFGQDKTNSSQSGLNPAIVDGTWSQSVIDWAIANTSGYVAWSSSIDACPCLITNWNYTSLSTDFGATVVPDLESANPVLAACGGGTVTDTATRTRTATPTRTPTPTDTRSSTGTFTRSATPSATASTTPNLTPTSSATPSRSATATDSPTNTVGVPSATDSPTVTPSSSASSSATLSATRTRTQTSSPSPSGTLSSSPSGTATSSVTPGIPSVTDTPTVSASSSASPSSTATATRTRTQSYTPSATVSPTGSPSGSVTNTDTPGIPSLTATPTLSPTSSASPSASPSNTPTRSSTASATVTSTPSASPSSSATLTDTPDLPSPTPTSTESPSATPHSTATASVTALIPGSATSSPTASPTTTATSTQSPGGPAATATAPTGASGPLQIVAVVAVPNPNPRSLAVELGGPADGVSLKLYTTAMQEIRHLSAPGGQGAGWIDVALPVDWTRGLANGTYYVAAEAMEGSRQSPPKIGKFVLIH